MDDEDLTNMLTDAEMLDLASEMSLDTWIADGADDSYADIDGKESILNSYSTSSQPPVHASYSESRSTAGIHFSGVPQIAQSVKLPTSSMDYSSSGSSTGSSIESNGNDKAQGVHDSPKLHSGPFSTTSGKQKLFSRKKIIKSVNGLVGAVSGGLSRHLDWFQKKYVFDNMNDVATSDEISMSAAVEASLQDSRTVACPSGLAVQDDQIVTKLLYSIRRKDRKETNNAAILLLSLCRGAESTVIIQQLQQVGAISTLLSTLKRSNDWPEVEVQLATLIAVLIPHETEWTTIIRHASDILAALADLSLMKVSSISGNGIALSSVSKPSSGLTRNSDGVAIGAPGRFPSMSSASDLGMAAQEALGTRSRGNSLQQTVAGVEGASPSTKSRPTSGRRKSIGGGILSKSLSVDTAVGFAEFAEAVEAIGAAVKGVVDMGSGSSSHLPVAQETPSQSSDLLSLDDMSDRAARDNFRLIVAQAVAKLASVLCAEWSKTSSFGGRGSVGGGAASYNHNKAGNPMSNNLQLPIEDIDILMTTNASVGGDDDESYTIPSRQRTHSIELIGGASNIGGSSSRGGGGNASSGNSDMLKNLSILMNIIDIICGSTSSNSCVAGGSSGNLFTRSSPKLSPKPTLGKTFSFNGGKELNLFGIGASSAAPVPVDSSQQACNARLIIDKFFIDSATITCSVAVAQIANVATCRQCFVSNGALKLLMTWFNMCTDCIVDLHKQKLAALDSKVYVPLVELLANTCSAVLSLTTMEDSPFGLNNSNNEYSIGWTDAQVLGVGIPTALVKLLLVSQGVSAMIADIDVPEVQHMVKVITSLISVCDNCAQFPAFPAVCKLQLAESLSNLASRQHNRNLLINAHVPIMLYMLFIDCVGSLMNSGNEVRQGFSTVGDDSSLARFISSCLNGLRFFLEEQYSLLIDLLCADEFLDCIYFVLFRVNTHVKFIDCRLAVLRLLSMFTEWGQAIDCLMNYSPSTNPAIFSVNDRLNHEDDNFVTLLLTVAIDNEEKGSSKYRRKSHHSNTFNSGHSGHSMSALAQSVGHAFGFAGGSSLSGIVDNVMSTSQQAISGITSGLGFHSPTTTAAADKQLSPSASGTHSGNGGIFFGSSAGAGNDSGSTPSSPVTVSHKALSNREIGGSSSTTPGPSSSNGSQGSPVPGISPVHVMPPKPAPAERDISSASNLSLGNMSHTSFGEDTICSSALVISVQMAELIALSVIFANICVFNSSYAVVCHQKGLLSLMLSLMKKRNEQIKRQAVRCIKALSPILLNTPVLLVQRHSTGHNHQSGRGSFGHQNHYLPPVRSPASSVVINSNNDELGLLALKTLIRAFEIENPGIQRDALLGIIDLAKTDNEHRRAICDSIVFGPLKSFVGILLDPYSERDIRILAEEVLNAVGFHGLADLELCQYDVQLLLDWYKLRRLCTIQQLVFDYDLQQWLSNELFNLDSDDDDDYTDNVHSTNWSHPESSLMRTKSVYTQDEEGRTSVGGTSTPSSRFSLSGTENSSSSLLGSAAGGTFRHTLYEHSPLHKISKHASASWLPSSSRGVTQLNRALSVGVMKYFMPSVLCFGQQPRSFSEKSSGYSGHHNSSLGTEGIGSGAHTSSSLGSGSMKGEVLSMVMERDGDKEYDSGDEDDDDEVHEDLVSGRDSLGSNISKVMGSLYDLPSTDNADSKDRESLASGFDGIEYSSYVENVMPYDGKDMLPLAVQELLETFYPSKLQHHIITGLMALGSDVISEKHIDSKTHIIYETCYAIPKYKPIMAILFPSRPYLSFKRVGRIIEKTIQEHIVAAKRQEQERDAAVEVNESDQGATARPDVSTLEALKNAQLNFSPVDESTAGNGEWALTFRNSAFEGEFHISFLSTLRKCPQITTLNFVSAEVYQDTTLGWLAGHVPNSVQYMAFQHALSSDAIDSLCILLKQNNASFKRNQTLGNVNSGPAYIHPKDRKGLRGLSITHTPLNLKDIEVLINLITRNNNGNNTRGGGNTGDVDCKSTDNYEIPLFFRQKLLPNPPGLMYLDLSCNRLSDQTCAEVLLAACRSGTIEGLDLGGSNMHKAHLFIDMVRKLSPPFLSGQCKLKHLGLRDNNLQGKFLCRFVDAIKEYKCLTSLDLSDNEFPYSLHFKENIRTFLRTNKYIRKLNLCNCKLNGESTKSIHLGLLENETLLLLPLARNMAALHSPEFSLVQEKLANNRRIYQLHRGNLRLNIGDLAKLNAATDISSANSGTVVAEVATAAAVVKDGDGNEESDCASNVGLAMAEAVPIQNERTAVAVEVVATVSGVGDAVTGDNTGVANGGAVVVVPVIGTPLRHSNVSDGSVGTRSRHSTPGSESAEELTRIAARTGIEGSHVSNPSPQLILPPPLPLSVNVGSTNVPKTTNLTFDRGMLLQSSASFSEREPFVSGSSLSLAPVPSPAPEAVTNAYSRDSSSSRVLGSSLGSSSNSSELSLSSPVHVRPTVVHAENENSWTDRGLLSSSYHATSSSAQRNELRVMFASPLAWRDRSQKFHAIPMLDYISERDQLIQVFKEVNRSISVAFDFATTDKLRTALSFGCRALHFSGHGHPNCLNFEDGRSGLQLLSNEALKDLVNAGGLKLEFLFVSACHSRKTGEAFVDAGVRHVVCVKVEEKILDSAAIAFTRAFYLSLLSGGTVQHSFDIARQALRSSPYVADSVLEGDKFILLPEVNVAKKVNEEFLMEEPLESIPGATGRIIPPDYHDVRIFTSPPVDEWPEFPSQCMMSGHDLPQGNGESGLSTSILTQVLPSPPPDFEGREVDIHKVIMTLLSRRLVSVVGKDSVGKSSLTAAVSNYLSDRCIFEDGIQYVRCQGLNSHVGFIKALYNAFMKASVKMNTRLRTFASTMNNFNHFSGGASIDPNGSRLFGNGDENSAEDTLYLQEELLINCYGNLKMLLILDHTNEMLKNDNAVTDLKMFISRLFSKCKFIKVLMTSTESLSSGVQQLSSGLIEYTIQLGPLSLRNSLRLFAKLTPVLFTSESKVAFVESLMPTVLAAAAKILVLFGDGLPGIIVKMASEYDADAVNRVHAECKRIIADEAEA